MVCGGCSGACKRILGKLEGVSNVDADLEAQKVTVTYDEAVAATTPAVMLEKLEAWGANANKKVAVWTD